MFSYIHLNIVERLLYGRYSARHGQKDSNELEMILCPFVIYNQHLPVLKRIEPDSISAGRWRWDWISLGRGGERGNRGNFLSNYSEVESGREYLRMTIWQGTVWEQNDGMSQEEQLQEINKRPDWSRLALNTGVKSLSSVLTHWCTACVFRGKA